MDVSYENLTKEQCAPIGERKNKEFVAEILRKATDGEISWEEAQKIVNE